MAVWNTDVKQNSTIADRSGGYALEFMANRSGAMETDYRPVETGAPYRFVARLQTSLAGANDSMEVTARWYDDTKTLIGAAVAVYASAPLAGAGAWYELAAVLNAPANAQYATVRVEKDDTTTAYIGYCDYAEVKPQPVGFLAYLNNNTAYATGATIIFDQEIFDHGSNYNTVAGQFSAPADGPYTFSAATQSNNWAAGTEGRLQLIRKTAAGVPIETRPGQSHNVHTVNDDPYFAITDTLLLSRGDTVEVNIVHDQAGPPTFSGNAAPVLYTRFSGFQIRS
jgi:hypothetical protein